MKELFSNFNKERITIACKSFFRKNLALKILSVGLAFLVWFLVAVTDDIASFAVNIKVPVTLVNLSSDYVAMNEEDYYVDVKVTGARSQVSRLEPSDILAMADMNNRGEGTNTVSVNLTLPETARLLSVNPSTIDVKLDAVISRNFIIEPNLEGQVAKGYQVASNIVVSPSDVVITGPRTIINSIGRVEAIVNVDGAEKSLTRTVPILVYDQNDNLVNDPRIAFTPELCTVGIIVGEVVEVPVNAAVNGTPRADYQLGTVTVQPEKVKLLKLNPMDQIRSVSTYSIDIEGEDGTIEKMVGLNIPDHYQLADTDDQYVTVRVEINRLLSERHYFNEEELRLNGQREGFTYTMVDKNVAVSLKGVSEALESVTSSGLRPTVYVANLSEPGEYTVPVYFTLPDNVQQTEPVTVKLLVEAEANEETTTE